MEHSHTNNLNVTSGPWSLWDRLQGWRAAVQALSWVLVSAALPLSPSTGRAGWPPEPALIFPTDVEKGTWGPVGEGRKADPARRLAQAGRHL